MGRGYKLLDSSGRKRVVSNGSMRVGAADDSCCCCALLMSDFGPCPANTLMHTVIYALISGINTTHSILYDPNPTGSCANATTYGVAFTGTTGVLDSAESHATFNNHFKLEYDGSNPISPDGAFSTFVVMGFGINFYLTDPPVSGTQCSGGFNFASFTMLFWYDATAGGYKLEICHVTDAIVIFRGFTPTLECTETITIGNTITAYTANSASLDTTTGWQTNPSTLLGKDGSATIVQCFDPYREHYVLCDGQTNDVTELWYTTQQSRNGWPSIRTLGSCYRWEGQYVTDMNVNPTIVDFYLTCTDCIDYSCPNLCIASNPIYKVVIEGSIEPPSGTYHVYRNCDAGAWELNTVGDPFYIKLTASGGLFVQTIDGGTVGCQACWGAPALTCGWPTDASTGCFIPGTGTLISATGVNCSFSSGTPTATVTAGY